MDTRPLVALACVASLSFALGGCMKTVVEFGPQTTEPVQAQRQHFMLYGLLPAKRVIKLSSLCGEGMRVSFLRTKTSFVDGLLTAITIGIYAPKTLESRCTEGDAPKKKKKKGKGKKKA